MICETRFYSSWLRLAVTPGLTRSSIPSAVVCMLDHSPVSLLWSSACLYFWNALASCPFCEAYWSSGDDINVLRTAWEGATTCIYFSTKTLRLANNVPVSTSVLPALTASEGNLGTHKQIPTSNRGLILVPTKIQFMPLSKRVLFIPNTQFAFPSCTSRYLCHIFCFDLNDFLRPQVTKVNWELYEALLSVFASDLHFLFPFPCRSLWEWWVREAVLVQLYWTFTWMLLWRPPSAQRAWALSFSVWVPPPTPFQAFHSSVVTSLNK